MDKPLTHEQKEQLLCIAAGLRANKNLLFDENEIKSLREMGLVLATGISIRLTPLGERALVYLRDGGLSAV